MDTDLSVIVMVHFYSARITGFGTLEVCGQNLYEINTTS